MVSRAALFRLGTRRDWAVSPQRILLRQRPSRRARWPKRRHESCATCRRIFLCRRSPRSCSVRSTPSRPIFGTCTPSWGPGRRRLTGQRRSRRGRRGGTLPRPGTVAPVGTAEVCLYKETTYRLTQASPYWAERGGNPRSPDVRSPASAGSRPAVRRLLLEWHGAGYPEHDRFRLASPGRPRCTPSASGGPGRYDGAPRTRTRICVDRVLLSRTAWTC